MRTPRSAVRVYDAMMAAPEEWWLVPTIMEVGGLKVWTAYPGLGWLEANGRVEARWTDSEPRRRQYRLTNGGNPPTKELP